MEIGLRIKDYLISNGISQTFISAKTGISTPKLNLALNAKRRLTLEEYEAICSVLGVSCDKFLCSTPPEKIAPAS